jgi:hypothetical protein
MSGSLPCGIPAGQTHADTSHLSGMPQSTPKFGTKFEWERFDAVRIHIF